jgi:hypothetical protein
LLLGLGVLVEVERRAAVGTLEGRCHDLLLNPFLGRSGLGLESVSAALPDLLVTVPHRVTEVKQTEVKQTEVC